MTQEIPLKSSLHPSSVISSDRVEGTAVYGTSGEKLGSIDNLMIDKTSGHVRYAVLEFGGFLGTEFTVFEQGSGCLVQGKHPELFCQLFHRAGPVDAVGAHPGPPQGGEMSANTQMFAEVTGQGTDIGSGGAFHRDVDVLDLAAAQATNFMDIETADRDGAGRKINLLAAADPSIGTFAVDLDGTDGGGHLVDVTGQLGHLCVDLLLGDCRCNA